MCYFVVHCILESRVNGPDGKVGLGIIIISILWVLGIFMDLYCMSYMHPLRYIHATFYCHLTISLIIVIIIRLLIVIMDRSWFMGPDDVFVIWDLCISRYGCWMHRFIMGAGFISGWDVFSFFWYPYRYLHWCNSSLMDLYLSLVNATEGHRSSWIYGYHLEY